MRACTQLYLEPNRGDEDYLKFLSQKIEGISNAGFRILAIWPSKNTALLRNVVNECKRSGLEVYLWYPLLCDVPVDFDIEPFKVVGVAVEFDEGESAILQEQKKSGEEFDFLCPNKVIEQEEFYTTFESFLETAHFDGVFFDRIRYPSPANGLTQMLSCTCEKCREISKETVKHFEQGVLSLVERLRRSSDVKTTVAVLQCFYSEHKDHIEFRERSIVKLLSKYVNSAKSRGLKVGVDLFTPSLSFLVSQNYQMIVEIVDWIKPMIYCKTFGPAGIPMEIASLIKIFQRLNPSTEDCLAFEVLKNVFDLKIPSKLDILLSKGVPITNFRKELKTIQEEFPALKSRVYPGFEAVFWPSIASISKSMVKEYLKIIYEGKFPGFFASWDINKIPLENLRTIGDFIENTSKG